MKPVIAANDDDSVRINTWLEEIREKQQEAFENLPESLQESVKGERMEEAITSLDNAIESLDSTE